MVKRFLIIVTLLSSLNGDIYDKNCVSCHNKLPVTIDKFFFHYLLKYSSERKVKEIKDKFIPHYYDFFYEYASDSGNVPSC